MSRTITTGGEALRAERMAALRRRIATMRRQTVGTFQRSWSPDGPSVTAPSAVGGGSPANFGPGYGPFWSQPLVWQDTGIEITVDSPRAEGFIYFVLSTLVSGEAAMPVSNGTDATWLSTATWGDRAQIVTDAGGHMEPDIEITPDFAYLAVPRTAGLHTYTLEIQVRQNFNNDTPYGGTLYDIDHRRIWLLDTYLTAFVLS